MCIRYMAQSDHLRITWVIAIHRWLHCASAGSICEVLEGLAFWESPWKLGGLCRTSRGRLACPSPLELPQTYSKCSPLTVLLWPQVQNYSLTKLRLILVGAMASPFNNFEALTSGRGISRLEGHCPTLTIGRWCRQVPMANGRIAHHRLSDQRSLCERVEALVARLRGGLHSRPPALQGVNRSANGCPRVALHNPIQLVAWHCSYKS